jgi:hypothetical protein
LRPKIASVQGDAIGDVTVLKAGGQGRLRHWREHTLRLGIGDYDLCVLRRLVERLLAVPGVKRYSHREPTPKLRSTSPSPAATPLIAAGASGSHHCRRDQ